MHPRQAQAKLLEKMGRGRKAAEAALNKRTISKM
jgi:hypothetical protein